MELSLQHTDSMDTNYNYSNALQYFIGAAGRYSVYKNDLFHQIIQPLTVHTNDGQDRDYGAALLPRLELRGHIDRLRRDLIQIRPHNTPFIIDSDDFSLAMAQLHESGASKDPSNVVGLFLASWFLTAPLDRLHIGSTDMEERLWGMNCPAIRYLVSASTDLLQELQVEPVALPNLPIPSLGHYLIFSSLPDFLNYLAFHFVSILDRFAVVPVKAKPNPNHGNTRILDLPLNIPVAKGRPKLPTPTGKEMLATLPTKSELAATPSNGEQRQATMLDFLKNYHVQTLPKHIRRIVKRGHSAQNIPDKDLEALLWMLPLKEVSKYLQISSQKVRGTVQRSKLIAPDCRFFHAAEENMVSLEGKIVTDYAMEPGYSGPSFTKAAVTHFMDQLIKRYRGPGIHPLMLAIIQDGRTPDAWSTEEAVAMVWMLPIKNLCLLYKKSKEDTFNEIRRHHINPIPTDAFWESVLAGKSLYPNGIQPGAVVSVDTAPPEVKARLESLKVTMAPYTNQLAECFLQTLVNEYSLEDIPEVQLQQLLWAAPIKDLCEMLDTSRYKIEQRVGEHGLSTPKTGFWLQVKKKYEAYPNGFVVVKWDAKQRGKNETFDFDTTQFSETQLQLLNLIRFKMRMYVTEMPTSVIDAITQNWSFDALTKTTMNRLLWSVPPKIIARMFNTTVYAVRNKAAGLSAKQPAAHYWDAVKKGHTAYSNGSTVKKYIAA